MLDDDLAAINADALALGMADAVTYTYATGGSVSLSSVVFNEVPQPYISDEGAEVRRREADVVVRRSQIATASKDDALSVASGANAGVWTVYEVGPGDDGAWSLRVRLDERIKMAAKGARRLG